MKRARDIDYDVSRIKNSEIDDHSRIVKILGKEVVVIARTIELADDGPGTVRVFPRTMMKCENDGAKKKADVEGDRINIKDEENNQLMSFPREVAICVDICMLEDTEEMRNAIARRSHTLYMRAYRARKKEAGDLVITKESYEKKIKPKKIKKKKN